MMEHEANNESDCGLASQTESQAEQGNGMTEAIRLPCGGREPPHAKPKGNIMCNGGGAFSPEEVEYLRSLPVVAEATSRRITYTESFKHNCMRRYHAGESPVELFREAGLDPSLIGYKRIERCFALAQDCLPYGHGPAGIG